MKVSKLINLTFILMNVFFAIYITSGVWKSYISIYEVIYEQTFVDITVLFACLLVLIFLFSYSRGWLISPFKSSLPVILFSLFFLFSIISVSYSRSEEYVNMKVLYLCACIIAFFIPLTWTPANKIYFFKTYAIVALISSVAFLYFFPVISYEKLSLTSNLRSVYLQVGYLAGLAVLIIYLYIEQWSFLWIGVMLVLSAMLLLTGARGPILFTFSLLLVSVFFKPRKTMLKHMSFIVLLFFATLIFYGSVSDAAVTGGEQTSVSKLFDRTFDRFTYLFSEEQGHSVTERKQYFDFSIQTISEDFTVFLSGFGYAGFGMEYTGNDIRAYPHNILLEAWLDSGVLAFIVLTCLIFYPFYGLYKVNSKRDMVWLLYLILNSFKSFSVVESRALFAFLAIAYAEIAYKSYLQRKRSVQVPQSIPEHVLLTS